MQGAEDIDLTVGDHFVYSAIRLGDFPKSRIIDIQCFEHQNREVSNKLKVIGKH